MILDMQQSTMIEGFIAFPDFAFAGLPSQPSSIAEKTSITGGSAGSAASIGGTVGQTSQAVGNTPFPGS